MENTTVISNSNDLYHNFITLMKLYNNDSIEDDIKEKFGLFGSRYVEIVCDAHESLSEKLSTEEILYIANLVPTSQLGWTGSSPLVDVLFSCLGEPDNLSDKQNNILIKVSKLNLVEQITLVHCIEDIFSPISHE